MAYCGPRGIPLDEFLAWPRTSRDAALAWARHEAEKCPSCRTRKAQFTQAGPHAFEAVRVHCRGCEITERGQDDLEQARKANPKAFRRGVAIALRPTSPEVPL